MYYAYVIKSEKCDYLYKGHCRDLELRLRQHNSGQTKSIIPYIPFKLIYYEEFECVEDAMIREKYFKSSAGRRYLKSRLSL
ncbi:Excinuclease ABC C subunit domain protein [Pseudopedobacter saltans DSM 12145]|uniref:Excinuclease ABC C subunit domain protein n=1 Tax=Pseudopedobacter saltans (strain ATCC 51119 / DSM 12145 / JCM 21818 / CCUG 39354 / LMG 10337 / NBRC 100064 / NCIMB 13643) TaxID=762903 RepID=F0SAR2_PSESL|nr:Excinuclease ABC C subunit domain protein [Pseudopedobacter saltans DSM 12145]